MSDLVERLKRAVKERAGWNGWTGHESEKRKAIADAAMELAEEALRAELSRLSALVAWQDIETAPKDGTRILIEFVHANAKFSPDPVGEGWIAVHEAYWLDHNAGGWTWYGLSGVATRWLPLPAPPVSQLKDTTNADK